MSSPIAASFDRCALGRAVTAAPLEVTSAAIRAYAQATNDASTGALAGTIAPPVYAVVPTWEVMREAQFAVVPEEARPLVLHGEQDLWIHTPIRAGTQITVRAVPVGIDVKASGTTLVLKFETRDEAQALLNEQYMTLFYRGIAGGESAGDAAPDHATAPALLAREPDVEITYLVDADQPDRYAIASGDHFPIHLDDQAARAVGLPGRIAHGLCVMAFAGRAALEAEGRDVDALRRLAVRFSRPVFPGAHVTTRLWRVGSDATGTTLAFEAHTDDGTTVLKDGLAVVG